MVLRERNDPETGYSDPPGRRALAKGSIALVMGIMICVFALVAASFGLLPALVFLAVGIPLSVWGSKKLKHNESQIRPQGGT